ncbi:MAG: hypothetical protein WDZ35_07455 [Crocinitomicaceae bacterium]
MKTTIITLIFMGSSLLTKAQDTASSLMIELDKLDSCMSAEISPLSLAANFEMIGQTEKGNWLPYYYAAYCYVMDAFTQSDSAQIEQLLDQSTSSLAKADSLCGTSHPIDQSEINCMKSLIASARITVDPANRGMQYGMEASKMMSTAKTLCPDNPRVYLLEAQSLLYTPEAYGGGCENARAILKTALEKYTLFTPSSELHPNWGQEEVERLLEECGK